MYAGAVLTKELQAMGKRKHTFVLRPLYVALLSLFVFLATWFFHLASFGTVNYGDLGRTLFRTFAWIQIVCALLLAPALAAGVISDEKRANTLALLFLTPLTGREIITGKFASLFLNLSLLLLSGLPVLCVITIFGGVTVQQILIVFSLTVGLLALTTSVTMFFSLTSDRTLTALIKSYIFVGLYQACIPLVVLLRFLLGLVPSGGETFRAALFNLLTWTNSVYMIHHQLYAYQAPSCEWIYPLSLSLIVSLFLLLLAMRLLPGWALPALRLRERPRATKAEGARGELGGPGSIALRERKEPVGNDPVRWREVYVRGKRGIMARSPAVVVLICIGFFLLGGVLVGLLSLIPLFLIISRATRSLLDEKEDRSLELVLTTALSDREIVKGKVLGLGKSMFPLVFLLMGGGGWAQVVMYSAGNDESSVAQAISLAMVNLTGSAVCGFALFALVILFSLWFAASSRTPFRTIVLTILALFGCQVGLAVIVGLISLIASVPLLFTSLSSFAGGPPDAFFPWTLLIPFLSSILSAGLYLAISYGLYESLCRNFRRRVLRQRKVSLPLPRAERPGATHPALSGGPPVSPQG